jgi:hypothetical protein
MIQLKLTLANDIKTLGAAEFPTPKSEFSMAVPGAFKKDFKKEFPGILEYVKKHDCSFTEAIRMYEDGRA